MNKFFSYAICLIAFTACCNLSNAQKIYEPDSLMMLRFDFEDKQLSEFFDRFNYTEPIKFPNKLKSTRARNIIALFNLKDSVLVRKPEMMLFTKYASADSNKVHLDFENKNWFAIAHCAFNYHQKSVTVDVILQPEGDNSSGYKWVIADVKSGLFPLQYQGKNRNAFIDPADHEIGFSELSKALKKGNGIFSYTAKTYHNEPLSAFLYMVQAGDLKFTQVNTVDFLFMQVKGWSFIVKNYTRPDYNSGWLIASLKKMSNEEKGMYIKNHFND